MQEMSREGTGFLRGIEHERAGVMDLAEFLALVIVAIFGVAVLAALHEWLRPRPHWTPNMLAVDVKAYEQSLQRWTDDQDAIHRRAILDECRAMRPQLREHEISDN